MNFDDLTIQPKPSSGNRCYTVQDLQNILGVSRGSVYNLLKRNEFRWIRIGTGYRIPKRSFDEWLDARNSVHIKD